jgi:UDP-N-acetylglucosamine acyltransferase
VTAAIHATAVVDPKAEIGSDVEIGPYATVGAGVKLAEGVVLHAHACVMGRTEIGPGSVVYPFAVIGAPPQDQKFAGEDVRLVIGARNQFREHTTAHPGTKEGGGLTSIGNDNLIMGGAHIAHDCVLGNSIILSNQVMLAGHVTVQDHAVIQASTGIQQFLRVGEAAFIGGLSGLLQDAPPFCFLQGYPARVIKVNRVKLERIGWDPDRIQAVEKAFRIIFRSKLKAAEAFARVREELPDSDEAERLVAFCESAERGFARMR